MRRIVLAFLGISFLAFGCRSSEPQPTAEEAAAFVERANADMLRLGTDASRADWVYSTYITPDTEALTADAERAFITAMAEYAKGAARFDTLSVPPDVRRQLDLLKRSLEMVTPADPAAAAELTRLSSSLEGTYGKGRWCRDTTKPDSCLDIEQITNLLAGSRDEARIREAWEGWHTISQPMRRDYQRFVELANVGARELGFADTGEMWRVKYDMPAAEFTIRGRPAVGAGAAPLRVVACLHADKTA